MVHACYLAGKPGRLIHMQGKAFADDITVTADAADFINAYARMHLDIGDWANRGALALLVTGTVAVLRTGPPWARWALLLAWGLYIQQWSIQFNIMALLVAEKVIPLPSAG